MAEKKQELEKRLQDVSGQLGVNKKQQPKKGKSQFTLSSNVNTRTLWIVRVWTL